MRLIDADALKEKSYWECYSDPDDDYEYVLVTDIDRAPTIDAVHIVRCNDCKWFDPSSPSGTIEPIVYRCKAYGTYHIPEFFCSIGERRTDAN